MAEVTGRAAELTAALEVGAPWLDPLVVEHAITTIERSMQRLELDNRHTVVALVGATGSGKSSLFNALARMEIAQVGARRPLTAEPMACVWGEGGSGHLLDWLNVPETRRMTRESVLDADDQAALHGLVLLDLPDHDSTEVIHRVAVDHLVTMVDLLVWVVDPQKYADDALHSGYLQRLVEHAGVMVVVLNQIDRLRPDEAETCERDLRRLLDGDGLTQVRLLTVSATRGDGVDDLRSLLAEVVQNRSAISERIDADLRVAADAVRTGLALVEPGNGEPPGADHLIQELAGAAGVPVLIDALAAEYRRRGWQRAGWPILRWLRRLASRDRRGSLGSGVTDQDLKLITAALPPVSAPAQRARVELAVEAAVAASADALPQRWADAVRESISEPGAADLAVTLDEQIAGVDLKLSPPLWWGLMAAAQYLLSAAAVVGAVWLALIGTGLTGHGMTDSAGLFGLPLPVVLVVVGLVAAAALAAVTPWALGVGARRRRLAAQHALHAAVEVAVYDRVIDPIRVVLAQHRATRLALIGPAELEAEDSALPDPTDPNDPPDPAGSVAGSGSPDAVQPVAAAGQVTAAGRVDSADLITLPAESADLPDAERPDTEDRQPSGRVTV